MAWYDYFKLFTYGFQRDPYSKSQDPKNLTGAGVSQPDALQTMGGDDVAAGSQGLMAYRQSNDMIDTTTLTNRSGRYKEYERLRNIPEIETVMTVISDEACVSASTKIATPFGFKTIKELVDEGSSEKFLVYCFDEESKDHTLGWAYSPRFVKKEETLTIVLEDGSSYTATKDHKVLMRSGKWEETGNLKDGDELMAFYRLPVTHEPKIKKSQFPRIFTYNTGWTHERFFVDKWRFGKIDEKEKPLHKALHMLSKGIMVKKVAETLGITTVGLQQKVEGSGFTAKELKKLSRKNDYRRVVGIVQNEPEDVYDISVEKHKCFCTDSVVLHNCQKDDNGNICTISTSNDDIKNEIEFLFFNRNMVNLNKNGWSWFKNLCVNGDHFIEIIINPENPEEGIYKTSTLPAETMYRIETTRGKLIEFQQSKEGPDYTSLTNPIDLSSNKDIEKSTAIRFSPYQIIHFRIGEDRKTFYPYGVSLIEPARSPAHQLRLMEDSMVVYRLARASERRVFYIDVGQLPPHKVDSLMDRMKDQFRKRKVAGGYGEGADKVDERWQPPAVDEDFWLPLRPGSNTRIETLPGACLALDTKIALLDGRNLELKEIIKEYNDGKKLWVYSIDPKTGECVPGPITWAGVTRKDAKVVKVTLDNGKSIICTPDHKFPVQGREGKIEAKDLNPGDSLWGFNRRHKKLRSNTNEYEQVYDNKTKEWIFTHRLVAEYMKDTDLQQTHIFNEQNKHKPFNCVHHYNFNRFNNDPTNLFWMGWDDHRELHQNIRNKIDIEKLRNSIREYHENLSDEQKKNRNEILKIKGEKGCKSLQTKLQNPEFNQQFRNKQIEGWKKARDQKTESYLNRNKKITERNNIFWSDPENKKKVFEKQTILYPESMFILLKHYVCKGMLVKNIIKEILKHEDIIKEYVDINPHIKRKSFDPNRLNSENIVKMCRQFGFCSIRDLRKHLNGGKLKVDNSEFYGRNNINFPQKVFARFMKLLSLGNKVSDILQEINSDEELFDIFVENNKHVKRKTFKAIDGIKKTHVDRMVKFYGYKNLDHAKEECGFYNHKILTVEFLDETIDTGTITVDIKERYNKHHTFALSDCGVYTYNSALGEVDDAIYFRTKLFVSLNFPKNYFSGDDINITKVSLSSQDVKFARKIERLQASFEDGLYELADRHLTLRGYPQELYKDLKIKMTPPSDWRELSRLDVINARLGVATQLKSSVLMSDYDIYINWLKYSQDQTDEMLGRLKIQKLEELKIQVLSQNPQLLGVGVPKEDSSEETELGTEPGGPTANLEAPTSETPTLEGSPTENQTEDESSPKDSNAQPLSEPSEEDIEKYGLKIRDYETEMDEENPDYSVES
jgi:intein/homing endonuclease